MKAMILAAGLGTRLRPLTNDKPKALVEVAGRTMLERVSERLRAAGVTEVVVNTHHFADQVEEYLRAHDGFGMKVEFSREEELLDTGGGLKRVADFFLRDGSDEPFLLHNVDVLSTINLPKLVASHNESGSLATLAVQRREASRYLIFDREGRLCGRRKGDAEPEWCREAENTRELAFCGVHVISPRFFSEFTEDGVFSIIRAYLRLATEGKQITGYRIDGCYWRDLGKPHSIDEAELDLEDGLWTENCGCVPA